MNIKKATEKYEAWLAPSAHCRTGPRIQARADAHRALSLPARHLLPLGADLDRGLRRCGARAPRAGGGRPARGELRHLARYRRPPDLGHQRFRRSVAPAIHQRFDPPGHQRADGGNDLRPEGWHGAILNGYREALEAGGRPFVLAEHHPSLRQMATARLHDPEAYWAKLHALQESTEAGPAGASKAFDHMMPERGMRWRAAHRVAGLGSLGRQRFVALAEWRGGSVAREAKALAPSACLWAEKGKGTAPILYQEMLDDCAVRCRDPFVRLQKRWIVRRLAPDCSRIELSALPKERDETAAVARHGLGNGQHPPGHGQSENAPRRFEETAAGWLLKAARAMEKAVLDDFDVGQDGILRPIGNRPCAGGLPTRRKMPSCPTTRQSRKIQANR
jgi:hypothetical protein